MALKKKAVEPTAPTVNPLLLADIEREEQLVPDDNALAGVSALAQQKLDLEAEIALDSDALKRKMDRLNNLETVALPEAMESVNIRTLTLSNGAKLELKSDMSLSLPKKNMDSIIAWLKANKHADIIKREVSAEIPKGATAAKIEKEVAAALRKLKLDFSIDPTVNSATLKALLKEQLAKGAKNIDLQLFGAYEWKKAIITLPKQKEQV